MTKKELVAKIAAEQNLDPKKLERMNMEELTKMDAVVADAQTIEHDDGEHIEHDDLGEKFPEDEPEMSATWEDEVEGSGEEAVQHVPSEKIYIGVHPITLEKQYV